MSNLQIIGELTRIVEMQNRIIRRQADALAQLGAVCMEEEVEEVVRHYLGDLEGP